MIRPLELFIGLRYTRARRRNHFISFISTVSILGVSIGVWALITVLSIMNGFEKELKARILSAASHVTVSAASGGALVRWRELAPVLQAHPQSEAVAPFVLGQGMAGANRKAAGVLVRGVLPAAESQVSDVLDDIKAGGINSLSPGAFRIIIGQELAWQLGLTLGDKLTLVTPGGQATPAGVLPRLRRFTVGGIFHLGMYEYDSTLAFIHLADAAKLFRTGDGVSGLRLRIADLDDAPRVREQLRADPALTNAAGGALRVSDWTLEHRNFFRALQIERRVMFIILLLIVAVAAFNIVSTLVMVVTDKRADIAVLRTLGISPLGVMGVFMVQGTVIGVLGTVVGGALGVVSALNVDTVIPFFENLFGLTFFPADIYVVSRFPGELRWPDVAKITAASFALGFLATLYPAWRASRVQPAEALRYE